MKKFCTSIFLIFVIVFANISPIFAQEAIEGEMQNSDNISDTFPEGLDFFEPNKNNPVNISDTLPEGEDFAKLKNIFDTKFNTLTDPSNYNCINGGALCPNPFYTETDALVIRFIVEKNYDNHTDFFQKIFRTQYTYENIDTKDDIIDTIPEPLQSYSFNSSFIQDIFLRSFYQANTSNSTDIRELLEEKVETMASNKCLTIQDFEQNSDSYTYCYMGDNFKNYLPTPDEFWSDSVFNGGNEVKIEKFKNIINYDITDNDFTISYKKENYSAEEAENYIKNYLGDEYSFTPKDYSSFLDPSKNTTIPEILTSLPNDALVIYVNNPDNFFAMLKPSSSIVAQKFNINITPKITEFFEKFFNENIEHISKKFSKEFVIVLKNSDFIVPEFAIITHSDDANNFKNSSYSFNNFKIFGNSNNFNEEIINTSSEKFLKNSSDFLYVWQKKSDKINDVFVFVGDKFFENILKFENFISIQRNTFNQYYQNILQNYLDAYHLAFNKYPESLEVIQEIIDNPEIINNFEISSNHKVIAKNQETDTYTQNEINAYIFMREGYSAIWSATLDPMGLVINKYGDGFDIDFFMTPAPSFGGTSLEIFENIFKNSTKSHIAFLEDTHTYKGFLSLVLAADIAKIKEKFPQEIKEMEEELGISSLSDILSGEIAIVVSGMENEQDYGLSVVIGKNKGFSLETIKNNSTNFENTFTNPETYNTRTIYRSGSDFGIDSLYISENEKYIILSLSESDIKKLLDTSNINFHEFHLPEIESHTFFAAYFQEKILKEKLQKLLNNSDEILEQASYLVASYLKQAIISFGKEKSQNPDATFFYELGNIKIFEENYKFYYEENGTREEIIINNYSSPLLQEKSPKIFKALIQENQKLIDNFFFSLHFGEDEIGFKLRFASENSEEYTNSGMKLFGTSQNNSSNIVIFTAIISLIGLIGFAMVLKQKQKQK